MSHAFMESKEEAASLIVKLAECEEELEQVFRLRYKVFVEEEKNHKLYNRYGLEFDEYDQYCDHLFVKNVQMDEVIGTYRLLPGERAVQNRGFYSETEFDLSGFDEYKPNSLELGRSCVAYDYRGTNAIQMLWSGIAEYISKRNLQYLIGCASLRVSNINELNEIYSLLKRKDMITSHFKIEPLHHRKINGLTKTELEIQEKEVFRKLPPLLKGYQWLGAKIAGEPAYDPAFETTDFFILLEKTKIAKKYHRHFLEAH